MLPWKKGVLTVRVMNETMPRRARRIQHAPGPGREQGIARASDGPDAGRRALLRGLGGVGVLALGAWGWWSGEARATEGWLSRHPWLMPWIEKDGFDPAWLEGLLNPLEPDSKVLHLMDHQAEAKPYFEYRAMVLNWRRIDIGRRLIHRHVTLLAEVEAFYRVAPEIVVALWGLESDFGNNQGRFNVLRTLYTLSTRYPRRAEYFQGELRAFLLLCREEGWDPRKPKGSYAGAMGQVQMMPSSLRRHAVDFNQDGRRDVVGDVTDSLASIASFLFNHGWCPEAPLIQELPATPELAPLVSPSAAARRPWRAWREAGIAWPAGEREPGPEEGLALIVLEERDGPRYYMTFMNFWVITRWNRSNRFAMVVCEFARALRRMERACGNEVFFG
ncbi:MAG: lytic murein transglycosylase [Magnetococcales bacterium]|nr:lytic murein transglycosylase [Magnetococcales bacterium]